MSFENINLWFANDKDNKTIFAKDLTPEIKHNKYTCPICGGLVRPKTGEKMSWHYAHINAEDCNSETIVHWFVKHELLKVGDNFKVNINEEIKEYECKEIIKEKEYNTQYGIYKPDLTVVTTTNEVIYIEIANTNKKKIKDFIDMWKELGNTVIEFKVREVLDGNKIDIFNSIWYVGKEYNEQLKELRQVCNKEKEKYEFTKEQVEQIDWLIDDICKYNNGLIEIDELSDEIQCIENEKQRQLVCNIVRNKKCGTVLEDYVEYNENRIINLSERFDVLVEIPNRIYDRIYGYYKTTVKLYNKNIKLKKDIIDTYKYLNNLNYSLILINTLNIENIINLDSIICGKIVNLQYNTFDSIENNIYSYVDDYYKNEKIKKLKEKIKRYLALKLVNKFKNIGYSSNIYRKYSFEDYKILVYKTIDYEYGEFTLKQTYNFNYKIEKNEVEECFNKKCINKKAEMFCEYISNNTKARVYFYEYKEDIEINYGDRIYIINKTEIEGNEKNILNNINKIIK